MADPSRGQEEKTQEYVTRSYRDFTPRADLTAFSVQCKETDLFIRAGTDLSEIAMAAILKCRKAIEEAIEKNPSFQTSMKPLPAVPKAPPVIRGMLEAARLADVGPMAGVAGAVAEFVGQALKRHSPEVIVENGGDIFLHVLKPVTVSIFAGTSPLSMKLGIRIKPEDSPCGICTSSGTVGPSLSLGTADAITVRAASTVLADAAATSLGNRIRRPEDIEPALEKAGGMPGVRGAMILFGDRVGLWGEMDMVRLNP